LFDPGSFVRVVVFAVFFAGIEYRYVNRYEREPLQAGGVFSEKPVFWVVTPYHLYLLLPLFAVASFTPSISAWAGNTFMLAVAEDLFYFVWRRRWVTRGDWTTMLLGSVRLGRVELPMWWPLDTLVAAALFAAPV
jgi:hypothetical protein